MTGFLARPSPSLVPIGLLPYLPGETRSLAFGDAPVGRDLGLYMAYLTIPRAPSDDAWWRWYNAPGGRKISLRPDNVGSRYEDHGHAFARYAEVMRPFFDRAQKLWPGAPRLAHARTRTGIAVFNAALGLVARVQASGVGTVFSQPGNQLDFPDYAALER